MLRYLLLALAIGLGSSPDPIRLQVTPHQAFGPAAVRATITLEPNYLNSVLCLLWDSETGEAGSSCSTVPGQYAPKTNVYQLMLTPGEYTLEAKVYQGQHWIVTPTTPVTILSHQ